MSIWTVNSTYSFEFRVLCYFDDLLNVVISFQLLFERQSKRTEVKLCSLLTARLETGIKCLSSVIDCFRRSDSRTRSSTRSVDERQLTQQWTACTIRHQCTLIVIVSPGPNILEGTCPVPWSTPVASIQLWAGGGGDRSPTIREVGLVVVEIISETARERESRCCNLRCHHSSRSRTFNKLCVLAEYTAGNYNYSTCQHVSIACRAFQNLYSIYRMSAIERFIACPSIVCHSPVLAAQLSVGLQQEPGIVACFWH